MNAKAYVRLTGLTQDECLPGPHPPDVQSNYLYEPYQRFFGVGLIPFLIGVNPECQQGLSPPNLYCYLHLC